mmetsp:Transcript_6288/g.11197  ORF Transcript_6288/g.11197 Transcript_6288/m.11197 type:complete len:204 (+) Transcript_6288:1620-2231(+)
MICNDCDGIRRRHKEIPSQNHVPVSISIACRSEIQFSHSTHQFLCIRQVWIRMLATEIFPARTIHQGFRAQSKSLDKYPSGILSRHRVHSIKTHFHLTLTQKHLQSFKVKHFLQHLHVVVDWINHLNRKLVANANLTGLVKINILHGVVHVVPLNRSSVFVNAIRESFCCWCARFCVVLDSPVAVNSCWIVRCGQYDSTKRTN